ncbi:MAG: ribosome-associated translation inhibitor RaiA, partial [Candidatus Omnitrophica bacterium]|nr:ribosome-associated translation inhibitor RaiA [Candidatus Omnitrophota bacterium]
FADKPMLPEEAKLELGLTDKDFMMFKNADTGEINLLYRKSDGNFGLIEPDF